MVENDWWQITDFAVQISKFLQEKYNDEKASVHYNTVDKWFKALETKRIHYINRAAGEKVYDKLDLHIGIFIAEARRDNKFRLDVIYEQIPKNFDVRPFPDDFKDESSVSIDETQMQNRIMENITKILAQQFTMQEEKLQLQINKILSAQLQESVQKMLPSPASKEEERAKRMNETLTIWKLEHKLEELAIKEWDKLPEEKKMKKAGLFRKEEDLKKRDEFIREYKRKHMDDVLKEEYGIEENLAQLEVGTSKETE